tara:strand:+ start:657 stop:950 length:294 start_codon:yes stop_codon:yes gene_type:complete
MSKFSMTDSKINHNEKTGRVSLSFYSHTNKRELDFVLSLLGAYNSHGRQFDLDGFNSLEQKFNDLINEAHEILSHDTKEYEREMAEEDYLQRDGNIY